MIPMHSQRILGLFVFCTMAPIVVQIVEAVMTKDTTCLKKFLYFFYYITFTGFFFDPDHFTVDREYRG